MNQKESVRVCPLSEIADGRCRVVELEGHNLALFRQGREVFAVDNRCPHMGFPLHRGTVKDGILTCHWHHARFDLRTGGTFDLWADDVRAFPARLQDDEIHVDLSPRVDEHSHQLARLSDGLQRNIPLILAKSVLAMFASGTDSTVPFRMGLEFGIRNRQAGWGAGLTTLTAMMNLLPHLRVEDRAKALYQGLSSVSEETNGAAPRFMVRPLPGSPPDLSTLKRWFREFVEVRDSEGTERCIVTAVMSGAGPGEMTDLLFAAATDHRYIENGHTADFTNKALEALDLAGWELAAPILSSLAGSFASASRMEESNSWRNPVDLIVILKQTFSRLPEALAQGRARRASDGPPAVDRGALLKILLGEDALAIASALLEALWQGLLLEELAGIVVYAAALRIARFNTQNEFSDWDSALHSFTFANAIHQATRRAPTVELARGIFDAAMTVYLNRFFSVSRAQRPDPQGVPADSDELLKELPGLFDGRQKIHQAGETVSRYLFGGGDTERLLAELGHLLLREDRDFHTIQMIEAAFRQCRPFGDAKAGIHVLVAAARYLAAHAPTVRAQEQTFLIARRLQRGERLFE